MALKVSEILTAQLQEAQPVREKPQGPDFRFTLSKLGEEHLVQRLTGLVEDITSLGKKIADHMDLRELK